MKTSKSGITNRLLHILVMQCQVDRVVPLGNAQVEAENVVPPGNVQAAAESVVPLGNVQVRVAMAKESVAPLGNAQVEAENVVPPGNAQAVVAYVVLHMTALADEAMTVVRQLWPVSDLHFTVGVLLVSISCLLSGYVWIIQEAFDFVYDRQIGIWRDIWRYYK